MPVIDVIELQNAKLGLWQNTQSVEQLIEVARNELSEPDFSKLSDFSSEKRKKEWIVTRLLTKVINQKYIQITYNCNNKPLSDFGFIGISHSDEFVAVIFSEDRNVAVDIEKISNKTCKIAKKFLSDEEQIVFNISDSKLTTLLWSIKECVYKYYSEKQLAFAQNIKIEPFVLKSEGTLIVFLKKTCKINVKYLFYENFVLTYIVD
jgi:4'-phosphopantetheinyl transferase EntD